MRFMTFHSDGGTKIGAVRGDRLVDLAAADASLPNEMGALIEDGPASLERARRAVASAARSTERPLSEVTPALPIARPGKIVCVGLNYALHAEEGGHEIPTYPALFMRAATSLIAADAPIVRPKCSERLDWECELAIVIGRRCRHVPEAQALDAVFGYTCFNDVSVRDYQRKSSQWTAGKNFDGTGPLGPAIVTADELSPGATGLRISTRVNGATMQDSNTSDMIFSTARIIAILSEVMTLEPGDVIATGTPSGVAHARTPPPWLKAGDTVEVEIEGIGVLRNPVIDEK